MAGITIGKLADKTGFSVAAIRFYEEKELIGRVARGPNGRRSYDEAQLAGLLFIAKCREAGIGLGDIKYLINLKDGQSSPCAEAQQIVSARMADVRARISALTAFLRNLEQIGQRCSPSCCGPAPKDCTVFR